MVTTNSNVKIELTYFEWVKLQNMLSICAYDLRKTDPVSAKIAKEFRDKITAQLDKLDFSENEKLVDEINANVEKLDCEDCASEPNYPKSPNGCK